MDSQILATVYCTRLRLSLSCVATLRLTSTAFLFGDRQRNSIVRMILLNSIRDVLADALCPLVVWLQYAAFEEIETEDYERARDVYKAAIKLVPHKQFTFAKVRSIPLPITTPAR